MAERWLAFPIEDLNPADGEPLARGAAVARDVDSEGLDRAFTGDAQTLDLPLQGVSVDEQTSLTCCGPPALRVDLQLPSGICADFGC